MGNEADAVPHRQRVTYFDWLRGAATLAVVLLHELNFILGEHRLDELGSALVLSWTELQLVLTRWAVPAFLMVSGALLLDPGRPVSGRRVARYVARMLAVLAVFGPVYSCMSARVISPEAIVAGWRKVLTLESWDHLWYVYALVALYLLTPALGACLRRASRRGQAQVLALVAVLTLGVPTTLALLRRDMPFLVQHSSSLFYFLLGSYAHRYLRMECRWQLLGTASLLAGALGVAWLVLRRGAYPWWLLRPGCPLIAGYALMLFLMAKEHLEGREPPALLAHASAHSLAIYLLHPLVIVFLYRRLWWMPYQQLPPVAFELVVLGILLGVTIPAATLARRVPGLRRIL